MSYTTDDFEESLGRVTVTARDVARVIAAWGRGGGMGTDAGHYRWDSDGATEWAGGFLVSLKDGRFAYITGWCDYTGWGCQDGAACYFFDVLPTLAQMHEAAKDDDSPAYAEWDLEPSDLNHWLAAGAKDSDDVEVSE